MPVFEVEDQSGKIYEIEAPDQNAAIAGLKKLKAQGIDQEWKRGMLAPIEKNERTGQMRPAVPQLAINIGNSIKDAVTLPGDVFTGEVPFTGPGFSNMSEDTLSRADNAALVMSPSTPAARINMGSPTTAAQKEAAKRFQSGLKADQIPLNQAQQGIDDLGSGAMAMDLGPNLQQKAGGLAAAPGPAQKVVANSVASRAAASGTRVADDVTKAVGSGAPAATMIDDISKAQSAAAKPLYDAVRTTPVKITGNIKFIAETPMGKKAFNEAFQKAANDGVKVEGMTIGLIDYAKRSLDDIASAAARAGRNDEARQAKDLARILRTEADKLVPAYKAARDAFAGPAAVKEALETGTSIFKSKIHPAELKKMMSSMTTSEKDAMIQGARAALEDMMGNAVNDPLIVRNALRKTFNQEKLSMVIGKEATDDLLKAMEREIAFGTTRNTVTGNSVTAARQIGLTEAAPHLQPVNPPHGWYDTAIRIFNSARNKIVQAGQEKSNEELAKIMTSSKIPGYALQAPTKLIDKVAPVAVGTAARAALLKQTNGGGGY